MVGLDEYQRRRRDLEQREQALAGQERQLGAQVDRQAELARLGLSMEEFCRRVSQGLKQASWEQKRQLIEWLVARVVVTDGEVEIRYVIPTSPADEAAHFCHLRSDYRAADQPLQAVPPDRHPLREARHQLPGHGHAWYDPALAIGGVCRHALAGTASVESPRLDHTQLRSGGSPKMAKAKLNISQINLPRSLSTNFCSLLSASASAAPIRVSVATK